MPSRDIIVVGASAGGMEPLREVVRGLPRGLPAAVFVVMHIPPLRSHLPEILSRAGPLPATHPEDGERFRYGRIYVAPPDFHMQLNSSRIMLRQGPKMNGTRSAIDALFQ